MEDRPCNDSNNDHTERIYKERVDCVPDWIWDCDTDGNCTFSNTVVEGVLGYTTAEIVGQCLFDILAPEDRFKSRAAFDEAARTKQPVRNIVHRCRAKDGVYKTLESSYVPVLRDGALVGFRGISRDIIDELIFQKVAREAMANYRAVLENAPTAVGVLQGDRVVYRNPKSLEVVGYTPEEAAVVELFGMIHPDDRERAEDHYRRRTQGEDVSVEFELRFVTKSGEVKHAEVRETIITYNGAPALLYNAIDVTGRKRAEEKLKLTQLSVDRASEAVIWFDRDLAFTDVNEAACRLLGYSREELLGMTADDIGLGLRPGEEPTYWSDLEKHGSVTSEDRVRTKDGRRIPVETTANLLEFAGKQCFVAFMRDMTEHNRAEEEKHALEMRLEQQKRLFYRETILSVTDGKLEICEHADTQRYICKARITTEMRTASDVPQARHKVEAFCLENGIECDDLAMLVVAVGEAMANAVKHGEEGRVYAGTTDTSVWIAVADRGEGIESLLLPRVTLNKGFSTKPSLGLGYSIMLKVADRMMLSTGDGGTKVVLFKDFEPSVAGISPEQLPDTW